MYQTAIGCDFFWCFIATKNLVETENRLKFLMKFSHVAWNLGGLSVPLLVAAITVPTLVTKLGQERFGILALAWGLIGYASALDLGVGRALTQHVGKLIGKNQILMIPEVLATAARITLVAGSAGAVLIFSLGLAGIGNLIKSTTILEQDIENCIFLLAIALPVQSMSATYKGLNEAFLNFKAISILRMFLGAVNFGGPFLVCFYTKSLPAIIGSLVLSRVIAFFVYKKLALGCLNRDAMNNYRYSRITARSLFNFGGWLTVSSVISPILVQADRFVIAAVISAAAVFVYVLPYEIVVQSLILVGAISSVIFPGLTRLIHQEPAEWRMYFNKWLKRVAILMCIICVLIAASLPIVLPLWIKSGLNEDSIFVGQILCIGVFANSLGSMFYALLHAQGKTKMTAKLHLIELPLFIVSLFILIQQFGVIGAALAWTGRMVVDAIILRAMCK